MECLCVFMSTFEIWKLSIKLNAEPASSMQTLKIPALSFYFITLFYHCYKFLKMKGSHSSIFESMIREKLFAGSKNNEDLCSIL